MSSLQVCSDSDRAQEDDSSGGFLRFLFKRNSEPDKTEDGKHSKLVNWIELLTCLRCSRCNCTNFTNSLLDNQDDACQLETFEADLMDEPFDLGLTLASSDLSLSVPLCSTIVYVHQPVNVYPAYRQAVKKADKTSQRFASKKAVKNVAWIIEKRVVKEQTIHALLFLKCSFCKHTALDHLKTINPYEVDEDDLLELVSFGHDARRFKRLSLSPVYTHHTRQVFSRLSRMFDLLLQRNTISRPIDFAAEVRLSRSLSLPLEFPSINYFIYNFVCYKFDANSSPFFKAMVKAAGYFLHKLNEWSLPALKHFEFWRELDHFPLVESLHEAWLVHCGASHCTSNVKQPPTTEVFGLIFLRVFFVPIVLQVIRCIENTTSNRDEMMRNMKRFIVYLAEEVFHNDQLVCNNFVDMQILDRYKHSLAINNSPFAKDDSAANYHENDLVIFNDCLVRASLIRSLKTNKRKHGHDGHAWIDLQSFYRNNPKIQQVFSVILSNTQPHLSSLNAPVSIAKCSKLQTLLLKKKEIAEKNSRKCDAIPVRKLKTENSPDAVKMEATTTIQPLIDLDVSGDSDEVRHIFDLQQDDRSQTSIIKPVAQYPSLNNQLGLGSSSLALDQANAVETVQATSAWKKVAPTSAQPCPRRRRRRPMIFGASRRKNKPSHKDITSEQKLAMCTLKTLESKLATMDVSDADTDDEDVRSMRSQATSTDWRRASPESLTFATDCACSTNESDNGVKRSLRLRRARAAASHGAENQDQNQDERANDYLHPDHADSSEEHELYWEELSFDPADLKLDTIQRHRRMLLLMELQAIFTLLLPNMGGDYIHQTVTEPSHRMIMLVRNRHVVAGVCFLNHTQVGFTELVFCVVCSALQGNGLGKKVMDMLKENTFRKLKLSAILAYADNSALKYFLRQRFVSKISIPRDYYRPRIKEYVRAQLMEFRVEQRKITPFLPANEMPARFLHVFTEHVGKQADQAISGSGVQHQDKRDNTTAIEKMMMLRLLAHLEDDPCAIIFKCVRAIAQINKLYKLWYISIAEIRQRVLDDFYRHRKRFFYYDGLRAMRLYQCTFEPDTKIYKVAVKFELLFRRECRRMFQIHEPI